MKNREFEFFEELTTDEIELTEKEKNEIDTEEERAEILEKKRRFIANSEHKSECWYIENQKIKDLTKKITLKLGPHCIQEFIIILKTLQPKAKNISLSFLKLELQDIQGSKKFSVK